MGIGDREYFLPIPFYFYLCRMGTNFYLKQKLSKQEKEKAIELLNLNNYEELIEMLPNKIHIGKRSGGWRFHWDHNYFKFFKPSKESLIEWLKSGQIVDEYGEEFTFDQFWNKEIANFLYKGYDMDSYAKEHPEEHSIYWDIQGRKRKLIEECPELKNFEFSPLGELYIDNLRFSIFTDFS